MGSAFHNSIVFAIRMGMTRGVQAIQAEPRGVTLRLDPILDPCGR